MDSNGKWSYSCLQYQEDTWLSMARRYGIIEKGSQKVDDRIYDCKLQKALTRQIFIHEGYSAASHWRTSIIKRGLGMPPLDKIGDTTKNYI
jgi:DNA gyrase/topoisomerase IV subunit B